VIRHIALFNLKQDLDPADQDWIVGQILDLKKVPSVKKLALGRLLEPTEEWYQPRMSSDFGWALTMEFDDESALYAYQTDPFQMTVAQEVRKRITIIKVSDFVTI